MVFILVIYCLLRRAIGDNHPKYAECLVDYGFYLLNIDAVAASVTVYQVKFFIY